MKALKEFKELEGENVLEQIEGDAYNDSPNPIVRLVMSIVRIILLILGVKLRTYVIITNLRIVQVTKKTVLWGFLPGDTEVLTLNKKSIQSVGYAMATSWFIFKKYCFLLTNASGVIRITYNGKLEDLERACGRIDKLVAETSI